jgi:hypothetical protein
VTTEAQRRAQAERSRKGGLAKAAKVRGLKELAEKALIKDAEQRLSGICEHTRRGRNGAYQTVCIDCGHQLTFLYGAWCRVGVDPE